MRKNLLKGFVSIFLLLTFITLPVSAHSIVNSQDWHDIYILLLYTQLKNENMDYILNLGETDLLLRSLNKNGKYTVWESTQYATMKDLKSFMKNYGFYNVQVREFNSYKELQYSLYQEIAENVKGFIIIKPDFGYDAISVFPFAVKNKYWVLFYDEDNENVLLDFLNKNKEKPVIFYGEFIMQPWKKIKNNYTVINKGIIENNKEIVSKLWSEMSRGWVVLMSGNYIEKGAMTERMPILLSLDSPYNLARFLLEHNVNILEVIGPENVKIGQDIREASNKTIGVVVKVGRTFTNDPELTGKFYTLPVKYVDTMVHDLRLDKVEWDNGKILLYFTNYGNVKEYLKIPAIRIIGEKEETIFDKDTHVVKPGETLVLVYNTTVKVLRRAEILPIYGIDEEHMTYKIKNETSGNYFFIPVKTAIKKVEKEIKVLGIYYDPALQRLWIEVENPNKESIWAKAEFFNVSLLNRTYTLSTPEILLKPGKNYMPVPIFFDEKDRERNNGIYVKVFYGLEKARPENFVVFKPKIEKIKEKRMTGIPFWIIAGVILLTALILAILHKKGKINLRFSKLPVIRKFINN